MGGISVAQMRIYASVNLSFVEVVLDISLEWTAILLNQLSFISKSSHLVAPAGGSYQ